MSQQGQTHWHYQRVTDPVLSAEDVRVLVELHRRRSGVDPAVSHHATAAELARGLGWSEGEAYQSLARLSLYGYVTRVPTGALPRQSPYRLTESGKSRAAGEAGAQAS